MVLVKKEKCAAIFREGRADCNGAQIEAERFSKSNWKVQDIRKQLFDLAPVTGPTLVSMKKISRTIFAVVGWRTYGE